MLPCNTTNPWRLCELASKRPWYALRSASTVVDAYCTVDNWNLATSTVAWSTATLPLTNSHTAACAYNWCLLKRSRAAEICARLRTRSTQETTWLCSPGLSKAPNTNLSQKRNYSKDPNLYQFPIPHWTHRERRKANEMLDQRLSLGTQRES